MREGLVHGIQLDQYGVTAGVAGILITDPRLGQRYRLPQGAV